MNRNGNLYRVLSRLANSVFPSEEKKFLKDEYLTWLCFANAGMMDRGNLYCMNHAIQNSVSNHPVVEIGSFCGLSANALTYLLRRNGKSNRVISCDTWSLADPARDRFLGDSQVTFSEYSSFIKESFTRSVELFSRDNLVYALQLSSDLFFERWATSEETTDIFGRKIELGGRISFCYIDGNHSYEFAKRDFQNADRFLEAGGFILFDDSARGSVWEVAKLMPEIVQRKDYRLVMENPNHLFQKMF